MRPLHGGRMACFPRGGRAFRRQELGFLRCKKFKTEIIEKGLDNLREVRYNNLRCGRLAQLVAHPLDVREVTSSSLVSSTTKTGRKGLFFCFLCTFRKSLQIRLRRLPAGRGGGLFLKASPGLFSAVPNNSVLLQTLLQVKRIRPDRFRAGLFISSYIRPGFPRSSAPGRCPDRTLLVRRSVSPGRGRSRPLRL